MRKPRLGQNFLHDVGASRRIIDALGDISQSTVMEIGPGRGALTHMLSERAAQLIAIELDSKLAADLREQFGDNSNVEIVEDDFLNANLAALLKRHAHKTPVKVVGNIPYYITSDILLRLFAQRELIDTIVIMVQKEVADRLAAKPGSRDYGLLTVTAQLSTDIEQLYTLPPSMFSPAPKVHSTVLRLRVAPKNARLGVDSDKLLDFCKLCFSQKRKTVLNNLRGRYDAEKVKNALRKNQIPEDVRAERLPLELLADICKAIA